MTVIRLHSNPGKTMGIRYPSEAVRNACMERISNALKVIENAGAYRIVACPIEPGPSPSVWPISFETEAAAEMYRRDLILAAVDGVDNDACTCKSEWLPLFYEFAARVIDLLKARDDDSRDLATRIAREALHHWCPPGPHAYGGQKD